MLNLFEIEHLYADKTQLELARCMTFDFNRSLVDIAANHWDDAEAGQLLRNIIDHKHLLRNVHESLFNFFQRVETSDNIKADVSDTLRPFVVNGLHLKYAKTLLTTDTQFVSVNEIDYCIRLGPWQMEPVNEKFISILNEDLTGIVAVFEKSFPMHIIAKKKDVQLVDKEYRSITLTDGRVMRCHMC